MATPPAVNVAVVVAPMFAIALEAVRGWINPNAKDMNPCITDNIRNDIMDREENGLVVTRLKKHPLCRALGAGLKVSYDTAIAVGASSLLTLQRVSER